jgi:hypothetical protein
MTFDEAVKALEAARKRKARDMKKLWGLLGQGTATEVEDATDCLNNANAALKNAEALIERLSQEDAG